MVNNSAFEPHFNIAQLSKIWAIGKETVRKLVKDEPGVIKIKLGNKQVYTHYSVPESVARRIHTQITCEPE